MKNITKIAAAFIIAVGVVGMIFIITSGEPSFARIVEPLLKARTITFKITTNIEGMPEQTHEGMFMEPGLMRMSMGMAGIQIQDTIEGKLLQLMPEQKFAMVLEMENMPEEQNKGGFLEIREMIRYAQENEEASVEFLGKKDVEGKSALGFRINQEKIVFEIWADAENQQPIRIETSMGNILGKEAHAVMHDFDFDVDLDESLFSLEPPEGYQVISQTMDFSNQGEGNLIKLLEMTTEIPGSQFPDTLTLAGMKNYLTSLESQYDSQELDKREKMAQLASLMVPLMGGLTFLQMLPEQSDWHYVGKGVKVGALDTPIFWYKPEGSDTYRVIYADLTIKDLSANKLPEAPDAQTKDSQKSILEIPEVIKK